MGKNQGRKSVIVDGTGYSVCNEEEQERDLRLQREADRAWERDVLLPEWEVENEHSFQQRVGREQAEWESRSLWGKLTRPRFLPT